MISYVYAILNDRTLKSNDKCFLQDLKCLDGISSPSGMGKTTSVMFSLRNTVGCLVNALKIFEVRNR